MYDHVGHPILVRADFGHRPWPMASWYGGLQKEFWGGGKRKKKKGREAIPKDLTSEDFYWAALGGSNKKQCQASNGA